MSTEPKRLLGESRDFIGDFPPSTALAVKFLALFKDRKPNTGARYAYMLSAFFNWYSSERLPISRCRRYSPQVVPQDDSERLKNAIRGKKSHKKIIEEGYITNRDRPLDRTQGRGTGQPEGERFAPERELSRCYCARWEGSKGQGCSPYSLHQGETGWFYRN